jgi:hypothetical protein
MPIDPMVIEGRAEPTRFNGVGREIPAGASIQVAFDTMPPTNILIRRSRNQTG